jgi:hypothetical protein
MVTSVVIPLAGIQRRLRVDVAGEPTAKVT